MISTVRIIHRNVKNSSPGDTCLRWTAAGMLEPDTRFGKVQGYPRGSRTSPSRSSTTYCAAANKPDTPRSRRKPEPSLCDHPTRTAVTRISTSIGATSGLVSREPVDQQAVGGVEAEAGTIALGGDAWDERDQ